MSLSEKIFDSKNRPARRLGGVGELIIRAGVVLAIVLFTFAVQQSQAGHQANAKALVILSLCSMLVFILLGTIVGLFIPSLIYKNVDPNATPGPLVAEFIAEPTARLR